MKLIRFGQPSSEMPGILNAQGQLKNVSAFGEDYDENFFASNGLQRLSDWLKENEASCPFVMEGERLGPCIARPSKMICIGLNYAKHAAESGAKIPDEPIIFFKATSAICGPNDNLILPPGSEKTDWEVELAVVIEKKTQYVSEADAMDYVAGYALHNDYSERAYQLERKGQWVKGKSADTFAPLGPWMVSKDEIADPNNLHMWLDVNGERLQDDNTNDMIFAVPFLVSYLSQFMTLLPGDVISTGTPSGVGLGFDPPRYLKTGDEVRLGIEGLGESHQVVVAHQA